LALTLWREVLRPVALVLALALVLAALLEGPAIEPFLYSTF
jgi:hypothetical protein